MQDQTICVPTLRARCGPWLPMSGQCLLWSAKAPQEPKVIHVTCCAAYLYVIHFKSALNSGEAQPGRSQSRHADQCPGAYSLAVTATFATRSVNVQHDLKLTLMMNWQRGVHGGRRIRPGGQL